MEALAVLPAAARRRAGSLSYAILACFGRLGHTKTANHVQAMPLAFVTPTLLGELLRSMAQPCYDARALEYSSPAWRAWAELTATGRRPSLLPQLLVYMRAVGTSGERPCAAISIGKRPI